MPIYEYACKACGHETEIMHKISDPPATECPECHEPALTKLISAAGFRLGGGGWYETDFKSGNKRNLLGDKGEKKDSPAATDKPAKAETSGGAGKDPAPAKAAKDSAPSKPEKKGSKDSAATAV